MKSITSTLQPQAHKYVVSSVYCFFYHYCSHFSSDLTGFVAPPCRHSQLIRPSFFIPNIVSTFLSFVDPTINNMLSSFSSKCCSHGILAVLVFFFLFFCICLFAIVQKNFHCINLKGFWKACLCHESNYFFKTNSIVLIK